MTLTNKLQQWRRRTCLVSVRYSFICVVTCMMQPVEVRYAGVLWGQLQAMKTFIISLFLDTFLFCYLCISQIIIYSIVSVLVCVCVYLHLYSFRVDDLAHVFLFIPFWSFQNSLVSIRIQFINLLFHSPSCSLIFQGWLLLLLFIINNIFIYNLF